jgi:hypothetical protein
MYSFAGDDDGTLHCPMKLPASHAHTPFSTLFFHTIAWHAQTTRFFLFLQDRERLHLNMTIPESTLPMGTAKHVFVPESPFR